MISIITCPRPNGVTYLHPLLVAVDAVCPGELRFLFCDGVTERRADWRTIVLPPGGKYDQRDNKYVGWMAVEEAARAGEDLLFLEDDIRPVDAFSIVAARNHQIPDQCGFTSFHRSKWTTAGIHDASKFLMSQAVKIPMRSLAHLIDWRQRCSGDWEAVFGFDTALAVAGRDARWKYEQTERNYFDHVGEVSAVHNGADGRSVAL